MAATLDVTTGEVTAFRRRDAPLVLRIEGGPGETTPELPVLASAAYALDIAGLAPPDPGADALRLNVRAGASAASVVARAPGRR